MSGGDSSWSLGILLRTLRYGQRKDEGYSCVRCLREEILNRDMVRFDGHWGLSVTGSDAIRFQSGVFSSEECSILSVHDAPAFFSGNW